MDVVQESHKSVYMNKNINTNKKIDTCAEVLVSCFEC